MTAAGTARAEVAEWIEIHDLSVAIAAPAVDPGPRERAVTGVDPVRDLARRAGRWSHVLPSDDLAQLARFGAALAVAEADAWAADDAIVATSAFEDRRFLFSDRIVHWVVPWADVAARCHPHRRAEAEALRDRVLAMGDRFRPAPLLTGDEGLYPPGEDSFGPTEPAPVLADHLTSLHSGTVVFAVTASSLMGRDHTRRFSDGELADPSLRSNLAVLYDNASARWASMAGRHPGTERLWRDLSRRAKTTAQLLSDF